MPWHAKFSSRIIALVSVITIAAFLAAITWAMQPPQPTSNSRQALPGQAPSTQSSRGSAAMPQSKFSSSPLSTYGRNTASHVNGTLPGSGPFPDVVVPGSMPGAGVSNSISSPAQKEVSLENVRFQILVKGDKPENVVATKVIPFFLNLNTLRPTRVETSPHIDSFNTPILPTLPGTVTTPQASFQLPPSGFDVGKKNQGPITAMMLALITESSGPEITGTEKAGTEKADTEERADTDRFPVRVVVPVPFHGSYIRGEGTSAVGGEMEMNGLLGVLSGSDDGMNGYAGLNVFGTPISVSNSVSSDLRSAQPTWIVHDIADSPYFATTELEGHNFIAKPISPDDRMNLGKLVCLDVWIHALAESLGERVDNKDDLTKAETSLRSLLGEQYEALLERQKREVARLEERLNTLKAELTRRADAKERVVDVQLGKLILEAQGLIQ